MIKSRLLDRFLRYVQVDTTARDDAAGYPSSPGQLELGRTQLASDGGAYADVLNGAVEAMTHLGDYQAALPYAVIAQDRKAMDGLSFMNGTHLNIGDVLT